MGAMVDISGFKRQVLAIRKAIPTARQLAAGHAATLIAGAVGAIAPRDTRRYVRGYFQALADVGGKPPPLPSLHKSKYYDRIIEILESQRTFWGKRLDRLQKQKALLFPVGVPKRGQGVLFRKFEAEITKAQRRFDNAKRELEKMKASPNGIIVGFLHSGHAQADRYLVEVRDKVYGGEGVMIESADSVTVRIRNKEVHASFVELRTQTFSKALRAAQTLGVRRQGSAYFRALEAASKQIGTSG